MAVSRKDCTNVIFLHVIFLVALNIIHNPKLVNGDSTLIDRVCRDTPFPIDCHNCLGSNPLSSQADVKGLAGIAINCSYAPATDVDNLLRTYTTYGQSQYAFCLQQFDSIVQNLSLALQSWKNNQYRDSQNLLEKALGAYSKCLKSLNKPRYLDPFLVGLAKTRISCENSIGILSRISS
ncbi:hypothetical protein C3L33_05480, partial [Rhododendron williamsianum]